MTDNLMNNDATLTTEEKPVVTDLTVDKIFEQIMKITSQMDHVLQAMEIIEKMPASLQDHGNRGQAIGTIVHSREETNRRTLNLLEKMYDDLTQPSLTAEERAAKEAKRESKQLKRDTIRDLIIHNRNEDLIREFFNEL